jgi:hypothetical protein
MGAGSFLGVESGRGVSLTPRPLLVPRSKNIRAIPLLSLRAFVTCKKGETYLFRTCPASIISPYVPLTLYNRLMQMLLLPGQA